MALKGGAVSRYPVEVALKALGRLEHRGGTMPDGTGDGAGLLVEIPAAFFERELAGILGASRRERPAIADCAVGVFFLPQEADSADRCRRAAERVLRLSGLGLLGWRPVPIKAGILSARGALGAPRIEQVFLSVQHVEPARRFRTLFRARKAIEVEFNEEHLDAYVASLSHRTVVYKGLVTGSQLADLYADLSDPAFMTSVAVFHRRFSTNTFPDWRLAQPFRLIAHNGEINTILGNRAAVRAFEAYLREHAVRLPWEGSLLCDNASDSADFDAMIEAYTAEGRTLPYALTALKPPAWEQRQRDISPEMRAFFEWHKRAMGNLGSWEGPAALVAYDGEVLCTALDRMGLRPLRYALDRDGNFYVTSEVGCFALRSEDLRVRVQLEPGDLVVYRPATGAVDVDVEVYQSVLEEARGYLGGSFRDLNRSRLVAPSRFGLYGPDDLPDLAAFEGRLDRLLYAHGWESEERREAIAHMLIHGKEPVGSMGFDRPLSCFSIERPTLYRFLRQRFAEVTNPPIDPYREGRAMSLVTYLGARPDTPPRVSRPRTNLRLPSPIVTDRVVDEILEHDRLNGRLLSLGYSAVKSGDSMPGVRSEPVDNRPVLSPDFTGTFSGSETLAQAVDQLADQAVQAARDGADVLVLSDRGVLADGTLPIPPLLAVGAARRRIADCGLRALTSIVVQAADVQEAHDIACLLGAGADAVNPYALFAVARQETAARELAPETGLQRVLTALDDGLRRIMSKVGITTVQGYADSGLFEAVGLGPDVMQCLPHVASRLGGMTLADVEEETAGRVALARTLETLPRRPRDARAYPPDLRRALFRAARGDAEARAAVARLIAERPPIVLRDLLDVAPLQSGDSIGVPRPDASGRAPPALPKDPAGRDRPGHTPEGIRGTLPCDVNEVTSADDLLREHVVIAAMSRGALTQEAHETLARAANRLGMRSNCGEGGEEEDRNPGGHKADARSRIRQVASGRFGVDAVYLLGADEVQIKMAQGAKPGEGGQLLANKVTPEIARLRSCRPGIDLISPPPHHDIYSIEDLAQLIRDVRTLNPRARVSVKLAAVTGIGTIGVGVAKAGAEIIEVDGCDGGTGASPRASIEHAGLPIELGIRELHLALVANGLRKDMVLRAAGGLKNEEDVLRLALMGADEFAFGSAPMVALGCLRCGRCHTGRCPVRVAGDLHAQSQFRGDEACVETFFRTVAEGLRTRLAALGARTLRELVGRSDLLRPVPPDAVARRLAVYGEDTKHLARRLARMDLSYLTAPADSSGPDLPSVIRGIPAGSLVHEMEGDEVLHEAVRAGRPALREYAVGNGNSIDFAAPVIRWMAETYGRAGWSPASSAAGTGPEPGAILRPGPFLIRLVTQGRGGQSFGAFLVAGIEIVHSGSVNDGAAKGMSGGRIVVKSTGELMPDLFENGLVGSNAAYGATGGVLYVQGAAGQRLAVRNSGARIVVEGTGKYPCEYMTGGVVVCLGQIGDEIGAGMTDGTLYVYDPDGTQELRTRIHEPSVRIAECDEEDLYRHLKPILADYAAATDSPLAHAALSHLGAFWKIIPADSA